MKPHGRRCDTPATMQTEFIRTVERGAARASDGWTRGWSCWFGSRAADLHISISRVVLGLTMAGYLAACYDSLTAPMHPRPPAPLRSMSGPLGAAHPITIPALNAGSDFGAVKDEDTGLFLPDNSTVVIQVTGTVALAANSGYSPGSGSSGGGDLSLAGQSVPPTGAIRNGTPTHELMVTYHLFGQTFSPSLAPDSAGATTYSFTYRTTQGGKLLVSRSGVGGSQNCLTYAFILVPSCNSPGGMVQSYDVPSYKMSGVQTISANRLDDDVTLTAVVSTGAKGRSVTFTATPVTAGGGVMGWTWTPDSTASQTVACSGSQNPCVTNVYESGMMSVAYYLPSLGLIRHGNAHVSVIECPSADSLLNYAGIRTAFMRLDSLSNPSGPENTRHEHVAALVRDSSGFLSELDIPTISPTNNCLSSWLPPTPSDLGGDQLVAIIHTHPYAVGETIHCSDGRSGPAAAGGSVNYDWPTMRTVNNSSTFQKAHWHVPFYIIDTHNVYRMDPDARPGSDVSPAAVWSGGGCNWH